MAEKRILTIQDMSCVGQCSLTVALPVLSACGIEACPLPSAILSNHTGGFSGFTFFDMQQQMPDIIGQWKKEGIFFDALYTGYIGSSAAISHVQNIASTMGKNGKRIETVIVDPAMADDGVLYSGFDQAYSQAMKKLAFESDYLIPNLTEACMLSDVEYQDNYDEDFILSVGEKLVLQGAKNIIITGVSCNKKATGAAIFSNGQLKMIEHEKIGSNWYGTGDVFASAFTGAMMNGISMEASAKIAASFTLESIKNTVSDKAHWYGVRFEKAIPYLTELINNVKTAQK